MSTADRAELAVAYRRFAEIEAAGRSPVYADVAMSISTDDSLLGFLAALPRHRPQLFLGAVQYLRGPITGWEDVAAACAQLPDDIARVVGERTVQTNIPARCAYLLPVLAALPQPLALIEVGAAAGLCLYPDRYAYDYGGHRVGPPDALTFSCTAGPGTPLPDRPVEVVWRAGLDPHPLDVTDPDDLAWLDALVWPGEDHLRHQLHAAAAVARAEPPLLVAGDLRTDLPPLLAQAPPGATPVVFGSAVLTYVTDSGDRQRFADAVRASGAVWVAAESPWVVPGVDPEVVVPGWFALCRDGVPLARADPHGGSVHWL